MSHSRLPTCNRLHPADCCILLFVVFLLLLLLLLLLAGMPGRPQ
jgi:hypothetical protein